MCSPAEPGTSEGRFKDQRALQRSRNCGGQMCSPVGASTGIALWKAARERRGKRENSRGGRRSVPNLPQVTRTEIAHAVEGFDGEVPGVAQR